MSGGRTWQYGGHGASAHARRPWGGICRICGCHVGLALGGTTQVHSSEAQRGTCRGSGYAPRETMAGAA